MVSRELGRTVRYVDIAEAAAKEAMEKMGMPPVMVDWLMSLNAIVKAGHASHVTDNVALLRGRAPRTFLDFVKESVPVWR